MFSAVTLIPEFSHAKPYHIAFSESSLFIVSFQGSIQQSIGHFKIIPYYALFENRCAVSYHEVIELFFMIPDLYKGIMEYLYKPGIVIRLTHEDYAVVYRVTAEQESVVPVKETYASIRMPRGMDALQRPSS